MLGWQHRSVVSGMLCGRAKEGESIMRIRVKLYSILADYLPKEVASNSCMMDFPEGTTLMDVVRDLKVPEDDIKIMFLNGSIFGRGARRP